MPENIEKSRRVVPGATIMLTLALTNITFGFGGHPVPPGPPLPGQNGQVPPGVDGTGATTGGAPGEVNPEIPPILLKPDFGGATLPPELTDSGSVSAPAPDSTGLASTPEPATLLMGLLGVGALAVAHGRKRGQK